MVVEISTAGVCTCCSSSWTLQWISQYLISQHAEALWIYWMRLVLKIPHTYQYLKFSPYLRNVPKSNVSNLTHEAWYLLWSWPVGKTTSGNNHVNKVILGSCNGIQWYHFCESISDIHEIVWLGDIWQTQAWWGSQLFQIFHYWNLVVKLINYFCQKDTPDDTLRVWL